MTLKEQLRAQRSIRYTAQKFGQPVSVVRKEMQEAIDEAWENSNHGTTIGWLKYFPDGRKPTVEEFMDRLSQGIENGTRR